MTTDGAHRVLTISRTYRADVEDVWSACTDAQRIPRWFIPIEYTEAPAG